MINKGGLNMVSVYCEECEFETESENLKKLQHRLTDFEGALVSDGGGGYFSICPTCKEDSLVFES